MLALRILVAAVVYYALVFACGFALGVPRVLFLEPLVGQRAAELVEAPLMLAAILLAARFVPAWLALPRRTGVRLATGCVALVLMLASELSLVLLQRTTLAEYATGKDPVSGAVFGGLLLLFAVAPALVSDAEPVRNAA